MSEKTTTPTQIKRLTSKQIKVLADAAASAPGGLEGVVSMGTATLRGLLAEVQACRINPSIAGLDLPAAADAAMHTFFETADRYLSPDERWQAVIAAALNTTDVATTEDGLQRWTPGNGQALADVLRPLPQYHPVTIYAPWAPNGLLTGRYENGPGAVFVLLNTPDGDHSFSEEDGITLATWTDPVPGWARPRPPIAVAVDGKLASTRGSIWTLIGGRYRRVDSAQGASRTAAEMARDFDNIRVLVDAEGRDVTAPGKGEARG